MKEAQAIFAVPVWAFIHWGFIQPGTADGQQEVT